jgi:hypothetical protein
MTFLNNNTQGVVETYVSMFLASFSEMSPSFQVCFHHQLRIYQKQQRYADMARHVYVCLRSKQPAVLMRDIPMSILNVPKESSPETPAVGMHILQEMGNLIAAGAQWEQQGEILLDHAVV